MGNHDYFFTPGRLYKTLQYTGGWEETSPGKAPVNAPYISVFPGDILMYIATLPKGFDDQFHYPYLRFLYKDRVIQIQDTKTPLPNIVYKEIDRK